MAITNQVDMKPIEKTGASIMPVNGYAPEKSKFTLGKSAAFIIGLVCIIAMFILVIVLPSRVSDNTVNSFLIAIVTLVSGYIGLRVANNGVKGRCFSSGLWMAEHPNDPRFPNQQFGHNQFGGHQQFDNHGFGHNQHFGGHQQFGPPIGQ